MILVLDSMDDFTVVETCTCQIVEHDIHAHFGGNVVFDLGYYNGEMV